MNIRTFGFLTCIAFLFLITSCKDNTPSRGSKSDKNYKPEMGLVPMEYGQSFDLQKEEKIKEKIGQNAKKVEAFTMSPELIRSWQSQAAKEIEAEAKASNNKSFASLTIKPWVIDAMVVDQFADKSVHEGRWIRFKDDLTYDYGKYSDVLGKGKYYYNPDKEIITVLDDNLDVKPIEFGVGWDMGFVVIGGTKKYGDDGIMVKLIAKAELPKK